MRFLLFFYIIKWLIYHLKQKKYKTRHGAFLFYNIVKWFKFKFPSNGVHRFFHLFIMFFFLFIKIKYFYKYKILFKIKKWLARAYHMKVCCFARALQVARPTSLNDQMSASMELFESSRRLLHHWVCGQETSNLVSTIFSFPFFSLPPWFIRLTL
jgi:hypothetical protein